MAISQAVLSLFPHCFPAMEVAYPASILRDPAIARWVRHHNAAVHVRSSADLGAAISAGVHPARMTVHAGGVLTNELVFCAANLAVSHVVVDSVEHVEVMNQAIGRRRRQAVLVRVRDGVEMIAARDTHGAVAATVHNPRFSLVGLHAEIGCAVDDYVSYPAAVGDLVARMRRVWEVYGRVLDRLSLGEVCVPADNPGDELTRQSTVIDQSLDDACLTVDFPRPTVVVSTAAAVAGKRAA